METYIDHIAKLEETAKTLRSMAESISEIKISARIFSASAYCLMAADDLKCEIDKTYKSILREFDN